MPLPGQSTTTPETRAEEGLVSANLNVGNDRARLIDVLTQPLPFIGYPRTLNGLHAIDEVTGS